MYGPHRMGNIFFLFLWAEKQQHSHVKCCVLCVVCGNAVRWRGKRAKANETASNQKMVVLKCLAYAGRPNQAKEIIKYWWDETLKFFLSLSCTRLPVNVFGVQEQLEQANM